ncbi:MAG TPA: hypothetical protein VK908_10960 [Jiangellales bacterium]|nr:hypothetical protein [Jiangellales bacterium]
MASMVGMASMAGMANPIASVARRADAALLGRARLNAAFALAADRRRARDWRESLAEVDAVVAATLPRPA